MFQASPIYDANYAATVHKVVNQGGTSSGKTYSIMQVLFTLLSKAPNLICTVVGQDLPNLRKGPIRDADMIYRGSEELRALIKVFNKSERIYEYHNGSLLEFTSYDNWQDAKSGKRDYLFVNEANGIDYLVVKELMLRTRIRCFFDYNPNAEFWIHEKIIGKPDAQLIISDHRHNPFLPEQIHNGIEALKEEDTELYNVYARGKTGKIVGLVYRRWERCDAIPPQAKHIGRGLDFGFTNDPTASIDVFMQNGELWLDEILYEPGLTNPDIKERELEEDKLSLQKQHVGDSAEPKSIEELRRLGLRIEPAQKGADSVRAGINILKKYKMNVTRRSVNLLKELGAYKWKVEPGTGLPTNQPIDKFNHALDAVRYVALNKLQQPTPGFAYG